MAKTQKNKATEGHLGLLKAKLARLKSEVVSAATKGSGGRAGDGCDVTKVGDVRAGMIGFPSVGKSSLLTQLTGTRSEVASYEFTTLTWCVRSSSAPALAGHPAARLFSLLFLRGRPDPPLLASRPARRPAASRARSTTAARASSCWTCRVSLKAPRTARAAASRSFPRRGRAT
jgi:hypothetical protein